MGHLKFLIYICHIHQVNLTWKPPSNEKFYIVFMIWFNAVLLLLFPALYVLWTVNAILLKCFLSPVCIHLYSSLLFYAFILWCNLYGYNYIFYTSYGFFTVKIKRWKKSMCFYLKFSKLCHCNRGYKISIFILYLILEFVSGSKQIPNGFPFSWTVLSLGAHMSAEFVFISIL